MPDGLLAVVVALEELAATFVADALTRGWVEVLVPHVGTAAAGTATGQPANHLVVVDHQLEDHVELGAGVSEQGVEDQRLGDVARETIEQEALGGVLLLQTVAHHGDGDFVRDEVTGVHVRLRLLTQWRALTHVRPEDVTSRNLGDRLVRGDELGLRPLARSRGPNQDDAH